MSDEPPGSPRKPLRSASSIRTQVSDVPDRPRRAIRPSALLVKVTLGPADDLPDRQPGQISCPIGRVVTHAGVDAFQFDPDGTTPFSNFCRATKQRHGSRLAGPVKLNPFGLTRPGGQAPAQKVPALTGTPRRRFQRGNATFYVVPPFGACGAGAGMSCGVGATNSLPLAIK